MSTDHQPAPDNKQPDLNAHGAARRRLAKAGLGAAGVLWTLESRATLNSGVICSSPSAALSGGLSSTYGPPPNCQGRSPGYWSRPHHAWPVDRKTTMFSDVFDCWGKTLNTYGSMTMSQVIVTKDDKFNLGRHLVANYLNVMSGKTSFLDVPTLERMWNEIQATGQYSPAPGVYWTAEETKRYLESTYGGA